jgi:type IV pilus assembly protein PilP
MKILTKALILVLPFFLVSCLSSSEEELSDWMKAERKKAMPAIAKSPEPIRFVPQLYEQASGIEPFNTQKLLLVLRQETNQSASSNKLFAAENGRRKEPLEAVPLDSMAMVGTLFKNGQQVALVKSGDKLFQVKVGNYLGTSFGLIQKITESEVTLREVVQDGSGEWVEKKSMLQLQEKK